MYIAKVPNRSSRPTFLLRESYREGKKVKNRTLANLSHLPPEQIEALRRLFKGERMMPAEELFQITRSLPHGHVVPALENLAQRGLQPRELVADTAYGSADNALNAERMGTELVSPVAGSAQVVEEVAPESRPLTGADFHVDARLEDPAVCPGGHFATDQRSHGKHPNRVQLTFDGERCESCPLFQHCPAQLNTDGAGYVLTVDLAAANLERRRRAEADGTFAPRYRIRAGSEPPTRN